LDARLDLLLLLVLDPRGRLRRMVGNACEEYEDNEGGMLG